MNGRLNYLLPAMDMAKVGGSLPVTLVRLCPKHAEVLRN